MFVKLQKKILILIGKNQNNYLQKFLAKAVAGTFGIRVINAFLGYLISLLLARFLGAEGYGTYAYALAWIGLLQLLAMLGIPPLVTREIAIYQTKGSWNLAHGLLRWANQIIFITSVVFAFVGAACAWKFIGNSQSQFFLVFLIGVISLPLISLAHLRQSTMQAINHIVKGQLPEILFRPLLLILLLVTGYLFLGKELNTNWAIAIYVVSTAITFLIGNTFLNQSLPANIKNSFPNYKPWEWLQTALPFLFIDGMYVINNQTDTIMLGAIKDSAAVGIYTVANRGAGIITFVLIAFNISLGPTFASLYVSGKIEELQKVITKSCRLIFLAALPIALALIIFGYWFLLLFGSEFIPGKSVLTILCLGQLINACTGSVAILLNMTGHQKYTAIGVSFSGLLNIILNFSLIPIWGAEGAATATTISTIIWNLLLVFWVYKKLKIYPTVFGNW